MTNSKKKHSRFFHEHDNTKKVGVGVFLPSQPRGTPHSMLQLPQA